MIGIPRLPFAITEFGSRLQSSAAVNYVLIRDCAFIIRNHRKYVSSGTRRIPVQFAKKIVGNKQYGGVRQYIPLKEMQQA